MYLIIISVLLSLSTLHADTTYENLAIERFELSVNYHLEGGIIQYELDGLSNSVFEYRVEDGQLYMQEHEWTEDPLDCPQFEGYSTYRAWCTNPISPECSLLNPQCFWIPD